MEKFVIEGGQPLSGTVVPAGNKNAALPALAATLLTEEEVVLRNIPRIRDVEAMLDLLRGLGATAEWREDNVVAICAADVNHTDLDRALSERIRASFLLAGPLLARFGARRHAAARRRRDRPPPPRPAPGRLPRARRRRRGRPLVQAHRARRRAAARATSSWTSRR